MPPPLRLVLDTNVLLSLWVFDRSPGGSRLAPLRALIESGALHVLSRADCLAEFERVLGYPEFALAPDAQQAILADYRSRARLPEPRPEPESEPDAATAAARAEERLPKCSDRDDQKFLELARDTQAAALVTSDKALLKLARHRLLAGRFRILPPEQLLAELLIRPAEV